MPDNVRRVSAGEIEYRRKGIIKGWDTTEICTSDKEEINKYLSGMDPNTRVWISAYGMVYYYPGKPGAKIRAGRRENITLLANTPLMYVDQPRAKAKIDRKLEAFKNPTDESYDIEYYCVRTKDPVYEEEDFDF